MRLTPIPADRCVYAIKYGTTLMTRCMNKKGHNGPHVGKGLKKFPYQRIEWFAGDGREFITDKDYQWSWAERKQKENQGG